MYFDEYNNIGGYDWNAGMSNRAVLAYETGEKPKSKWSKDAMLWEIKKCYGSVPGIEKLTKAELFQKFFYCSSWHHCSGAFNRVDFYSLRDYIDNPAETVTDAISSRVPKQPKQEQPNLYVTAAISFKISVKGRRGSWKSQWVTDYVQYRSNDKMVSTRYGNKRLSCVSIDKKIEQKTKYAPIEKVGG